MSEPTERIPTKADAMPLVSVMERADMMRAIELMQDDVAYQEQQGAIAEARAAIKLEIVALAKKYSLPGVRFGNICVYYNGLKDKRTLNAKLVAVHLAVDVMADCYTFSKPYEDCKVVDLSKPRKQRGEETQDY